MPVGQYRVENAAGYNDYSGQANYPNMASEVTFGQSVIIRSVFVYLQSWGSSSPYCRFKVWRVSDGAQIASEGITMPTASGWHEMPLTKINLEANVTYRIGFHIPPLYGTILGYDSSGTQGLMTGRSTPAGVTSNWWGQYYYSNDTNDVMPTSAINDSLTMALSVDLNTLPNAPTSVLVENSPVPVGVPGIVSWQHEDPDGNPQAKYQIRWRKKD